jgi:predicted Fe-Mo cluster-binding NifX family protein
MTTIALTSQNRLQITEHAGRCRNFIVYEVEEAQIGEPRLVELPLGSSFHDMAHDQPHALDGVDVLISAGMGPGLRRKLAERGIQTLLTTETDPLRAVQRYLQGDLAKAEGSSTAEAHDHGPDRCDVAGHDHGHGHGARAGGGCCGCGSSTVPVPAGH